MAVIKTLDTTRGHLWNGDYQTDTDNVKALIGAIKQRKTEGRGQNEVDYIGEQDGLDVDISKVKCLMCKVNLHERLG